MAAHPVQITIGATLAASVGSAVRGAQSQLKQLGSTMAEIGNKQSGIKQLETLRSQTAQAAQVMRAAQQKVSGLGQVFATQQAQKDQKAAQARQTLAAAELRAAAAQQRVSALTRGVDAVGVPQDKKLQQLARAQAAATKAQASLQTARNRVARADASASSQPQRQAQQMERATAAAARAEAAYRSQRSAVDQLSTSLQRSGVNLRATAAESAKLGSAMALLRSRTDALTQAQQAQARNLERRSAYRAQMMDAVALGGALYGLVKPAVQFESVMADVKKVVNFDAPQQFTQMGEDVLKLSTRIPMAADGIGAIVAAAGQAGIAREELLRFAEDAAKMGVAFDLSGEQSGAAMAGLRSIFGLTQDQVVLLGDSINHLSNNMDAKAGDLLAISNRVGSTAKLFGLSGAQANALGATFLALKTPPEVAATGINALLMKLATADKQGAKFQQGLQDIGLSAAVMKKMIGQDAQGAIVKFLEQVKSAPDVMGTLSDLFGAEYADDIAKLVGSLDTYKGALGLVANQQGYAGSMEKEFASRAATTANNLQLLGNQVSRLGITLGNALLPPLNTLVGALAQPLEGITALAQRFPMVTLAVIGTLATVLAAKVAMIGLGFAFTFVKGPILAANTAFHTARAGLALLQVQAAGSGGTAGLLATAWTRISTGATGLIVPIKSAAMAFWGMLPAIGATTAALLANPITWIVAGIGAAVAGLAIVIRKYWEPVTAYLGGVWDGIEAGFAPAIAGISSALTPLVPIGNAIASIFGFIGDVIGGVVGWVGQLLAPVKLTKDEFDSIAASGQSLGQVMGTVLGAAFTAVTYPVQLAAMAVGAVIGAFQTLLSVGATVRSMLSGLPGQFMSMGQALVSGLAQGIRNSVSQAVTAVGEVGAAVRDSFKALLGIHSPSRVFATLGSALSLGLAQGVAAAGPEAVNQVGQLAQSLQAVPLSLGKPEVSMPGLRLPSPDRPSLGLALPLPAQSDSSVPGLRPVWKDTVAQPVVQIRNLVRTVPSGLAPMSGGTSPAVSPPAMQPTPTPTAPTAPGTPSINFAPQITINAPAGSDAKALADLLEGRLRSLIRDALRGSSAALHD